MELEFCLILCIEWLSLQLLSSFHELELFPPRASERASERALHLSLRRDSTEEEEPEVPERCTLPRRRAASRFR